MSELLDFYAEQAQSVGSTIPWVAALQNKALQEFSYRGFPVRKDEEWKYTPIDAFLQHRFAGKNTAVDEAVPFPFENAIKIINGQVIIPNLSLPTGVIVLPLAEAFSQQTGKIQKCLENYSRHLHGFHALNTACLNTGLFIYVPEDVHMDHPLYLMHFQTDNQAAHQIRHVIIAETGSALTVVEDYSGAENATYFTNTVTDVILAPKAKLVHYKIQRESKAAFHIGLINVQQATGSQFDNHSFSFGGKLVRSDLDIQLAGEYAQCLMNGVYVPNNGQHIDHHTTVHHDHPNGLSRQDYKGILNGQSRAVFNGKVIVAKDAQHTHAQQHNKNLLLSKGAEIDTKPQLEIFADDVICSHGATVGQLDEEALFYLATRGIAREEASAYLVHAFATDNLQCIPHPQIAEWVGVLLNQQLGL